MKIEILYAIDIDNNDERKSLFAVEYYTSLQPWFVQEKITELLLTRYGMTDKQIESLVDDICEGKECEFGAYEFHWETIEMQTVD